MKALVTGASGFIGRYIVRELLEHGYDVRVLVRNIANIEGKVEIFHGDITKLHSIFPALKGVDVVFHNAAYAMDWGRKRDFYEINVNGTRNVAEACRKNGIERIIYTSSAGIYGFPNRKEIIDEDSPKKPINYYQQSKLEAEKLLMQYEDLHVSSIRPPLVIGAGGKAVKMLLSSLESGKMPIFGSGEQYISIAHPKDVAQCLRLAYERDKNGEAFNVLSFACPVKELLEKISYGLGVKLPQRRIPYSLAYLFAIFMEFGAKLKGKEPSLTKFRVKSFGTHRIISCEKARKKLGFKPMYDLEATVNDIVEWYKGLKIRAKKVLK